MILDHMGSAHLSGLYDYVLRDDLAAYRDALAVLRRNPCPGSSPLAKSLTRAVNLLQHELERRKAPER